MLDQLPPQIPERLPPVPSTPPRVRHWTVRINFFGVIAYTIVIGWLFWASATELLIQAERGRVQWGPIVGLGIATVGLAALYFGVDLDPDE